MREEELYLKANVKCGHDFWKSRGIFVYFSTKCVILNIETEIKETGSERLKFSCEVIP